MLQRLTNVNNTLKQQYFYPGNQGNTLANI
jgi:hypothetical protein